MLVVPEPNRNKNGDELAKDAQKLIQQFSGICPAELPYDLPPLGNIQHQIDFVPGLTLTNLPHYRMNPKKHQIMQE